MSLVDLTGGNDARSTRGRVPVYKPLLNGTVFDVTVLQASFQFSDGNHDMATLTCGSATITTTDGMVDSCLSFAFGQAPRTEIFTGYILQADVNNAGSGSNFNFTLTLLGATRIMQVGTPRFWPNQSIPGAVQKLAYINGLGFYGHDQPFAWRALAQTGDTDWATVLDFADRLGWIVFNRYGVVLLYNPQRLFTESGAYATLRSSQNKDFDLAADRRMIEFNPQQISATLPERLGRQIAYFTDSGDIQVVKEIGTFSGYRFVTDFVIRNYEEAQIYANAGTIQVAQWQQYAQARIWGDTDIYPGMAVDVYTTNPTYYRAQYDGRWLVRGATHQMDTTQFQTMLSLVRPSNTTPITQTAYQPFWKDAGKQRPALILDTSATASTSTSGKANVWTSTWADPRVQSVA